MTKNEHQDRAVLFLENRKRLICQWATGVGKSAVAIKFLRNHSEANALILVPETNNIENWQEEFRKFQVLSDNVVISCYASLHKYRNTKWTLIVFDEAPHIDTQLKASICNDISGEFILALGAKIEDSEKEVLTSLYGEFAEYTISMSMAISQGLLPPPIIYVIHLQLDNINRNHYSNGRKITAKEYYDILNAKVEAAKQKYEDTHNKKAYDVMLYSGIKRKQFLGQQKEDAIKRICAVLNSKEKRFICFCSSVKLAERLGGDNAFTSKTVKLKNLLERFNNKEINSLYVVGKLIEGQNLKDIECGVLGAIGGTDRIAIQEIGRVMRAVKPVIYVPVLDDTKDYSFLKTVTYNIPEQYIKHYKF